jgi:FKBP-type peptidyl-prolyl cis-trans isomerase
MKKLIKMTVLACLTVLTVASCGDGFKTTKNGLKYKFLETNKGAQQVKANDVLVGTLVIKLDSTEIVKVDTPDRLFTANPPVFNGDLSEGLLMMHIGDKAIFVVEADSVAKYSGMPPQYEPGKGMKLSYEVKLTDIITKEEIDQERAVFMENYAQQLEHEKEMIAEYVAEHKIKATPSEEGLYIEVIKKGKGPAVEINRQVAINYTGSLLDGKVFDSSIEKVAKENGIYDPGRHYEPLTYTVGRMGLIQGWEKGVINQPEGSKLKLIFPSSLGYGPQENGSIPANSPLVFDIEIVSVK